MTPTPHWMQLEVRFASDPNEYTSDPRSRAVDSVPNKKIFKKK